MPEVQEAVGLLLDPVSGGVAEGSPVQRGHFVMPLVAQHVQKLVYLVLGQPTMRDAQQTQGVRHPAVQPCVDNTWMMVTEEGSHMPGIILHVCVINQPVSFHHPLGRYYNRPILQIRKMQHREVVSYPLSHRNQCRTGV